MSDQSRNSWENKLQQAFDAEQFRSLGRQVVDLLADYLQQVNSSQNENIAVLPDLNPDALYAEWDINENQCKTPQDFIRHIEKIIAQSQHLHHPHYIGHQVAAPLPIAALSDLVAAFLNSPSAIFEMGPVHTVMEWQIINWLNLQLGYSSSAGGFLTSGGSIGNFTALLAAREIKCRLESIVDIKKQAVLFSDQTHYSEIRGLRMMGISDSGALAVPTNKNYQIDLAALQKTYENAINNGLHPFMLIANACSTATGSFDDLSRLADFCEKYNIWFHVDGAHGASTVLSEKYRYLVDGIQRADSVVWDLHKMLMMPSLVTAVLFKNFQHSYKTFTQEASYIYDKNESIVDDKYMPFKRTIECTKNSMGLKFYLSLCAYGKYFFAGHVTHAYDLARLFFELLKEDKSFESAVEPQSNIVCFRYIPSNIESTNLNGFQADIQKNINKSGKFYIVKTILDNKRFLRISLMNPLTTIEHLKQLIQEIKKMGSKIIS